MWGTVEASLALMLEVPALLLFCMGTYYQRQSESCQEWGSGMRGKDMDILWHLLGPTRERELRED